MGWVSLRTAVVAVGIVVALVIGAAYAVVRSEEDARDELRDQLAERAEHAGRFTIEALLSPNEQTVARAYFGGKPSAIQAAVPGYQAQDPLPRVVILDARARVLGSDPELSSVQRQRLARSPIVRAALRGRAGVSNVFTAPGGERAFDVAIGFQTRYGRRVLLKAAPLTTLQEALAGYLPTATGIRGGRAYLLDARGRVLANSRGKGLGRVPTDAGLGRALAGSASGTFDDRYFASVPAGEQGWRVVFTAPTKILYAPVEGSRRLTGWLLFAGFTVALLALLAVGAAALYRSARLAHERLHDSLTGLPNRVLFIDRVDRALAGVHRHERPAALLFVDLDRFKQVNDRFGHGAGDAVLRTTADRLREVVRWMDTLSRIGGDEFVVLCEELADEDEALQIAARIQESLSRPIAVGKHEISLGCSIGIAIHNPGDTPVTAAQLIHDADVAMYKAKRAGASRVELFQEGLPQLLGAPELDAETALPRD